MRTVALGLLLTLALVGCAKSSATGSPGSGGSSGVSGRVQEGPTCPVQQIGTPCVKPWIGTVQATDLNGNVVGSAKTDSNGDFTMTLDPGTYMVSADLPGQEMPRGIPAQVTVKAGAFTHVLLSVDTGIR